MTTQEIKDETSLDPNAANGVGEFTDPNGGNQILLIYQCDTRPNAGLGLR
jgi:hypothetical protein